MLSPWWNGAEIRLEKNVGPVSTARCAAETPFSVGPSRLFIGL
jgi:hypothetical protein